MEPSVAIVIVVTIKVLSSMNFVVVKFINVLRWVVGTECVLVLPLLVGLLVGGGFYCCLRMSERMVVLC